MIVPSYFKDFLKSIRPQDRDVYINAHKELRTLLEQDAFIKEFYVDTFLQGSYRRATAIEPANGSKGDVDVVVVTTLDHQILTPKQAIGCFQPFLDKHYKGRWEPQTRAIKIESYSVDLDLVITAVPKEEENNYRNSKLTESYVTPDDEDETWDEYRRLTESAASWKIAPLKIPDRGSSGWEDTHPIEQLIWTWAKNASCHRNYVNVVKVLKYWKRNKSPFPKYPRAYPLEHLIGVHCPDGIESVAEGVTAVLESISRSYSTELSRRLVPALPDHGVPAHNVFARLSFEDFEKFHSAVASAATLARAALDSNDLEESVKLWTELLGQQFNPDGDRSENGFSERNRKSSISSATYG